MCELKAGTNRSKRHWQIALFCPVERMKEFEDRWLFQIVEQHRVISNYFFHTILYFSLPFTLMNTILSKNLFIPILLFIERRKNVQYFNLTFSVCIYIFLAFFLCVMYMKEAREKTRKEVTWIEASATTTLLNLLSSEKKNWEKITQSNAYILKYIGFKTFLSLKIFLLAFFWKGRLVSWKVGAKSGQL